jgi:hypothetical protein
LPEDDLKLWFQRFLAAEAQEHGEIELLKNKNGFTGERVKTWF